MKKAIALATMATGLLAASTGQEINNLPKRIKQKTILTPKQQKARKKNKIVKQARKKNR